MGSNKLRGKDLRKIAFTNNQEIALAIDLASKHLKYATKEEKLNLLTEIQQSPEEHLDGPFHELASWIINITDEEYESPEIKQEIELKEESVAYKTFGSALIDQGAKEQMEVAMKLPIAKRGALMPDAHHGYGLPIGGVLATKNAIVPYAVGLDIGCRMSLSLYHADERYLTKHSFKMKQALKCCTNFGTGGTLDLDQDHEIIYRDEFKSTPFLSKLRGKAIKQLGTSGSGNHFVEFGMVEISDGELIGVPKGNYLGILAHSGSRGMGAAIAGHYTALAKSNCLLPANAQQLAWLDMNSEWGQEYWLSMNLAGDYAKACHDQIHLNLSKYLGLESIAKVENHHNFAWKETHFGEDYYVHRKGATPAGKDILGIIPGSMTAKGYIVKGSGNPDSLNSASHGAGRRLSRGKAKSSLTGSEMKKTLKQHRVELIGGGVDEAPLAYKNIDDVMAQQRNLVEVIGNFTPRIVRMDKA